MEELEAERAKLTERLDVVTQELEGVGARREQLAAALAVFRPGKVERAAARAVEATAPPRAKRGGRKRQEAPAAAAPSPAPERPATLKAAIERAREKSGPKREGPSDDLVLAELKTASSPGKPIELEDLLRRLRKRDGVDTTSEKLQRQLAKLADKGRVEHVGPGRYEPVAA